MKNKSYNNLKEKKLKNIQSLSMVHKQKIHENKNEEQERQQEITEAINYKLNNQLHQKTITPHKIQE